VLAEQTVNEIVAESGVESAPQIAPQAPAAPVVAGTEGADQPVGREAIPVEAAPAEPAPVPVRPPEPDLATAGLQLVETSSAMGSDEGVASESGGSSSRRRRSRSRGGEVAAPAEPLVLVETKSTDTPPAQSAGESPAEWGPPSNPRRRARPKTENQVPTEPLVLVETKSAPETQANAS
jgi:hypothetical protein